MQYIRWRCEGDEATHVAATQGEQVDVQVEEIADDQTDLADGDERRGSEIGYRNSSDTLYHTWEQDSSKPLDPQEQAGAYNAALTNVIPDSHIAGIFFWGWENVGRFTLKGQSETLAVLRKWYTSTLSSIAGLHIDIIQTAE